MANQNEIIKNTSEIEYDTCVDEKEEREKSVIRFLNEFDAEDRHYFSEISGPYGIIIEKIKKGSPVNILKIDCFYKDDVMAKMRIYFDIGDGGNSEIILSGNELKDCLAYYL